MINAKVAGYVVAGLIAAGVALLAWNWPDLKTRAEAGVGYGARIGCSCRYVQGRTMESCEQDMETGMEIVMLDDLPDERAVVASVPLMAKRIARFQPGFGCVLD
ncbi:hypothetical protein [Rhizorhapis sp.]|uniref:hypothetical protein n=1 Tax=Rhizorhapis sp. TaxID=1968842 RepID=UPI002B48979C|nr:hypothetical protein [Rhizorhapis sp.]HKR18044.1 hypothetical protein [Rhizorhapis sp.]